MPSDKRLVTQCINFSDNIGAKRTEYSFCDTYTSSLRADVCFPVIVCLCSVKKNEITRKKDINKIFSQLVYLGNGKFKWQRDHDLFKEFDKDVLKIKGKSTVPRGGCKQIKTSNITLRLYENVGVLLDGPMVEA